jgi:hypothetical protein
MADSGRTNGARAFGSLCMAAATVAVTSHFAFAPLEVAAIAFCVGLGTFLLTAIVP